MGHLKWILLGVVLILPFAVYLIKPLGLPMGSSDEVSAVDKTKASGSTAVAGAAPVVSGSEPRGDTRETVAISAEDRRQDRLVATILASKNDNDPRLDSELRVLGEGAKHLLKSRYKQTPAEGLNERGTLVFLLGRNMTSNNDMLFMMSVVGSPRCLSLGDCAHADGAQDAAHEAHHSGTNAITLAYPQIVALKAIESYLNRGGNDTAMLAAARASLAQAAHQAPDPLVAGYARSLLARLGQ
jgi:hypothetical protein